MAANLWPEQVVIPPMANYRKQRIERNRIRMSAMGKASQRVQSANRLASLDVDTLTDTLSIPRNGDAIGSLEYRCFRTGKVRRWTILRGDRVDRVILRNPDGRQTKPNGWTWIMDHLRGFLAGRKC